MNQTTAIQVIKDVSGISSSVIDRLYSACGMEQPMYVGIERRSVSRTRCDMPTITQADVVDNMYMHSIYSESTPLYIIEEVALSEYITIQYTYTREDV